MCIYNIYIYIHIHIYTYIHIYIYIYIRLCTDTYAVYIYIYMYMYIYIYIYVCVAIYSIHIRTLSPAPLSRCTKNRVERLNETWNDARKQFECLFGQYETEQLVTSLSGDPLTPQPYTPKPNTLTPKPLDPKPLNPQNRFMVASPLCKARDPPSRASLGFRAVFVLDTEFANSSLLYATLELPDLLRSVRRIWDSMKRNSLLSRQPMSPYKPKKTRPCHKP